MKARKLVLENLNNVLALDTFMVINISPPRSRLPEYEDIAETEYRITSDGREFSAHLIDVWMLKFGDIVNLQTLMCAGMYAKVWKARFKEKHPDVTDDTDMAIYCYQKVQDLTGLTGTTVGNLF